MLVSTDWVNEHLTIPRSESPKSTSTPRRTTRGTCRARSAGIGPRSSATRSCATSIPKAKLEELLGNSGIDNDTTIILYGDNNNWFAAWAFWQLKLYGHQDVRIMDGGRKKWLAEGKELSTDAPKAPKKTYKAKDADNSLRAFLPEVQEAVKKKSAALVDVRSPAEFTGEILAPPGLPETCQRGGHIPGAKSMPWAKLANDDGTFKSAGRNQGALRRRGRHRRQADHRRIAASASARATRGSR